MEASARLGEFEALILASVIRVGTGANGVTVFQEASTASGREVSLPAVHVTLRRLEEKGLLRSVVGTSSERGGRPRRFYEATPDGVRAVAEFRDMWRRVWRGLTLPDTGESR